MTPAFGMEVTALVAQHYPAALKGDLGQIGECSAQLADCLGGLLAFAYRLAGEDAGRQAIEMMVERIIRSAAKIDGHASDILRTGIKPMIGN